jgi:ATP-dependent helicase HrpA
VRRLIVSELEAQFRYIKKVCMNMRFPVQEKTLFLLENRHRLAENTWQMICAELTGQWDTPPSRQELDEFIQALRPVMAVRAQEFTDLVTNAAECAARARKAVTELWHGRFAGPTTVAIADRLESDLRSLFPEDFPAGCRPEELEQYPRYLRAVETMARRAGTAPAKQETKIKQLRQAHEIMHAAQRYLRSEEQEYSEEMKRLRLMCRELMVSVYAPELGAMKGVSMKRIMRKWEEVRHAAEDIRNDA